MYNDLTSVNIWDNVWRDDVSESYIKQIVECSKRTILYRKMNKTIKRYFPKLDNIDVIELGVGEGIYSLLLGMSGANITCVDFSKRAISRARKIFDFYGLNAKFIESNIFDLPDSFMGNYDISISGGVAEHFLGRKREDVFKIHLSVLKPGGLALVAVPNAWCFPYRIMKYLMEKRKKWILGVEVPFSRKELIKMAEHLSHVKAYEIFGGSFWRTFYTNLFVPARIVLGKAFSMPPTPFLTYKVINEKRSIFDDYLGNLIVLALRKV